jgi:CBS domain-containing protein
LENKIGAVVVIKHEKRSTRQGKKHVETRLPVPAGIIANSDIAQSPVLSTINYQSQVGIDDACTALMNRGDLVTCTSTVDQDRVTRILEKKHNHHVIVVDEEHAHFVRLVSSWDIASDLRMCKG